MSKYVVSRRSGRSESIRYLIGQISLRHLNEIQLRWLVLLHFGRTSDRQLWLRSQVFYNLVSLSVHQLLFSNSCTVFATRDRILSCGASLILIHVAWGRLRSIRTKQTLRNISYICCKKKFGYVGCIKALVSKLRTFTSLFHNIEDFIALVRLYDKLPLLRDPLKWRYEYSFERYIRMLRRSFFELHSLGIFAIPLSKRPLLYALFLQ